MRILPAATFAVVLLSTLSAGAPAQSAADSDRPRAERLLSHLSDDRFREVMEEGGTKHYFEDAVELDLAFEGPGRDRTERVLRAMEPKIGVEALFLVEEHVEEETEKERDRALYNIFRAVSTMEGIEYYSASRERMRTFYHESYAVEDPESREPLSDPVVTEVPEEERIYVYQRDSSFGRNVYRVDYVRDGDAYLMSMTNLTRMYYGVLPVVAPENLEIHLTVMETEEGYLFYGACGVRVISLFGMQDRARDSFYNRIEALYRWFRSRVEAHNAP
ncbi:MAG: DUF6675 family protein [Spirochaetaceae bacterium]